MIYILLCISTLNRYILTLHDTKMVRQKKYKTTLREDVLRTVKENKEVSYRELKARLAVQDSSLKKALGKI